VATSSYEAEYMALALTTKQLIWLSNTLTELNALVTNTAMFCDNDPTIYIAYNHKTGDQSTHIDLAYHLVHEKVESGQISLLHVESGETMPVISTKELPPVTLWKARTVIMDPK
jgi:hypothetical protein